MVRRGLSIRAAAARCGMGFSTAWEWVQRAKDKRLDRVNFDDRAIGPRVPANRVSTQTVERILRLRRELKELSVLGEYGAVAIQRTMIEQGLTPTPSIRTIGRVLSRNGQLDGRRRTRRPTPPPGWHLPPVAMGLTELDSFDTVEGLRIKGGPMVEVLNGVSLHGKLVTSWPTTVATSNFVALCLIKHWKRFGLPGYAQFDNGTIFQGPHQYPDTLGRVSRLCLALGITPVFAPPREHGLQNQIESFNNLWQAKVWRRYQHPDLKMLVTRSNEYVLKRRERVAAASENAPRREFPVDWTFDPTQRPTGTVIFIRRTSDAGAVNVLGRIFNVDPGWPHRLVRAEVDLDSNVIHFFRLRRQEPDDQPLLCSVNYSFPNRRFR